MKSYINHFFSLKTGPELLPFFQTSHNTTAKEITESMAMYYAARNVLGVDPKNENVHAVIIGDGKRPRTGALLAHMTKWECLSIDPIADTGWWEWIIVERMQARLPIQRMEVWKCRAEDRPIPQPGGMRQILFFPHSHCSLEIVDRYPHSDVIAMPCCIPVPARMLRPQYARRNLRHYVDQNVWSPKNKVYIWEGI